MALILIYSFAMSLTMAMVFKKDHRTSLFDTFLKHYIFYGARLASEIDLDIQSGPIHLLIVASNIFIFQFIFSWLPSAYIMEYRRILENYV